MTGNILGENINPIIDEQIHNRQYVHGSGQTDGDITRTPKIQNYLNNKNAWVKLASGVAISGSYGEQKLNDLSSAEDNYLTNSEIQNLKGYGLAQNVILFNTTQRYDKETKSYVPRSGVRGDNTLENSIDKMYGGLGNNSRGLQPVPGITDVSVECLNRGSIRKATINIKAYNKFQFGLIELLYLRLGYMVMLEFGWDKYISEIKEDGNEFDVVIEDMGSTIIENEWFSKNTLSQESIFNAIDGYTEKYKGNYNGFFGKVSNFTWKLNKDNTYDITLNLITIGSVIESLKVNLPVEGLTESKIIEQKQQLANKFNLEEGEEGAEPTNPILNNAGADELSQFIASTVLGFPYDNINYVFLPNLAGAGTKFNGTQAQSQNRAKVPLTSRYYIRFGTLLEKLETIAIPDVKNGNTINSPLLNFDTNTVDTICSYQINLIPLSPSKVIFSPILDEQFISKTSPGVIARFNKLLLPFATEKNGVFYGRLLNCYFNLDFISQVLEGSKDKKGNVHIFKFLESLCDAINESTGNTTNLEPAIKKDRTIYILEQNPIKGFDSLNQPKPQTEIIVYGYKEKRSTFVKDFGFQTKITPDLAAMISIGAAAEGSTTKNINAIPFSYWNKGLKNRFQETLIDSANELLDRSKSNQKKKELPLEDQDIIDSFKRQILDNSASYKSGWKNSSGYTFTYNGILVGKQNGIKAEGVDLFSGRSNDSINKSLLSNGLKKYKETIQNLNKSQSKLQKELKDSSIKIVAKASSAANNYSNFLTNAFGGVTGEYTVGEYVTTTYKTRNPKTGRRETQTKETYTGRKISILEQNAKFWDLNNKDFLSQGKSSYKLYLNQIEQAEFNKQKPILSGEGFIPVELSLTMDGIGGIDIYNKISVDTRILPQSYPRSLKFIATKVNHKIGNNIWDTSITTISIPPTSDTTKAEAANPSTALYNKSLKESQPTLPQGPIPPISPNQKLIIIDRRTVAGTPFDTRTFNSQQSINWLVGEMNINTQSTWRAFFSQLESKYPGYTLMINATYRTYQRSIELKSINPKNATPGRSPHNYAYGLDMNVKDPQGVTYLKKDRDKWVASGIPSVAKSLNMRWGGDFNSYIDCVHFDVTKVTDASIRNAQKDNKGLPQSEWDTKNTNYV